MATKADRVTNAMKILKTVRTTDLKIENNVLFSPLYSSTKLERPNQEYTRKYGTDEVIRKNLYYLAEKVKNIDQLLIQLVQKGFLNLPEKDIINKHVDELVKSVEMMSFLIKKDSSRFKPLLRIFRETGNEELADILEHTTILQENIGTITGAQGTSNFGKKETPAPRQTTQTELRDNEVKVEPWQCSYCTFLNSTGRICSLCCKSNIKLVSQITENLAQAQMNASGSDEPWKCTFCTFLNSGGNECCDICANIKTNPK